MSARPRILVIKLGALGDFVLAFAAFAAIRRHHDAAEIVLLTTPPFAALARASGWFDRVWCDGRPLWHDLPALLRLIRRLRAARFARIYDLQTSRRSARYFHLLGPRRPQWSGIARSCSHRQTRPDRRRLHTLERLADQLAVAGIDDVAPPDLSWAEADVARFGLAGEIVLLVPGASAHRPGKRWPAARYGLLAQWLAARGLTPVVLGAGAEEAELAARIRTACPAAVSLVGGTDHLDLIALARRARAAIGNDTGPLHLLAAAGCPTLALFAAESDPLRLAPRSRPGEGPARWLQVPRLADLGLAEVAAEVAALLAARGARSSAAAVSVLDPVHGRRIAAATSPAGETALGCGCGRARPSCGERCDGENG